VPAGQFLVAKFAVAGDGKASVTSVRRRRRGGLTANVNRWRKQLGLGELTGDEVAKSVKTDGAVTFVEMRGQKASLSERLCYKPGRLGSTS